MQERTAAHLQTRLNLSMCRFSILDDLTLDRQFFSTRFSFCRLHRFTLLMHSSSLLGLHECALLEFEAMWCMRAAACRQSSGVVIATLLRFASRSPRPTVCATPPPPPSPHSSHPPLSARRVIDSDDVTGAASRNRPLDWHRSARRRSLCARVCCASSRAASARGASIAGASSPLCWESM